MRRKIYARGLLVPVLVTFLAVMLVVLGGCPDGGLGSDSNNSVTTDAVAPERGGDGTIAVSNIENHQLHLSWEPASDNETLPHNIEYRIYKSSNNISDLEAIVEHGIPVWGWAAGVTQHTVTGLDMRTAYQFNVVARDAAGNEVCYEEFSATTVHPEIVVRDRIGALIPDTSDDPNYEYDFGTAGDATHRSLRSLYIFNEGAGRLENIDITMSNFEPPSSAYPTHWEITSEPFDTIFADGWKEVIIEFIFVEIGTYQADVEISSNDPDYPVFKFKVLGVAEGNGA